RLRYPPRQWVYKWSRGVRHQSLLDSLRRRHSHVHDHRDHHCVCHQPSTRRGAMNSALAAFVAGLIFSLGLAISGMTKPGKVTAFLDLFGNWDPSLAFVM